MHLLNVKTFLLFFYLCSVLCHHEQNFNNLLSRDKRSLIWLKGNGLSRLQVIAGFGLPLDLKVETVILGTVIKGNYKLPMNATDYTNRADIIYERRRKRSSASRWDIYDTLAQMLQMRGFVGKACILRTICELASVPIDKNNGLFDEIVHVLFNPSSTKESVRHNADNEYFAAQELGKKSDEFCKRQFSECSSSLIDMFTM